MRQLILGGARSGKSRHAEQLAQLANDSVLYIATAEAGDDEMKQRIDKHKQQRPKNWALIEEPLHLSRTLLKAADHYPVMLVDCLSLYVSNWLCGGTDGFEQEKQSLLEFVEHYSGELIFVSNEVGMSIVPADPLSRKFTDELGCLHQEIAAKCERVILMVAGIAQVIKQEC